MKLNELHEASAKNFIKKAAIVSAALAAPYAIRPDMTEKNKPIERSIERSIEKEEPTQEEPTHSFVEPITTEDAMTFIEPHEGRRSRTYLDAKGIPTIGIGFNLRRPDAREKLMMLGHNIDDIMKGQIELTDEEINALFKDDVKAARTHAERFTDLSKHPRNVQLAIIDMAFNLGPTRLNKFVKFKKALEEKDYVTAAKEMTNSNWYHQVGNRSKKLVNIMNQRK